MLFRLCRSTEKDESHAENVFLNVQLQQPPSWPSLCQNEGVLTRSQARSFSLAVPRSVTRIQAPRGEAVTAVCGHLALLWLDKVTKFPNCCSRSSPKWILCFSTTGKHRYCCGSGSEWVLLTVHLLALWYNENGPNCVFSRLTSSEKLASTQVYLGLQRVFCTYWAFKFIIQKDASEKTKGQKKLR